MAPPRGLQYPVIPHNDRERWARLEKVAPLFVSAIGKESAELSETKTVENVSNPYPVLMTMKGTDAELAYKMTRAMAELNEGYEAGASGNNRWHISRQVLDWMVPYHDGAIKHFEGKGPWNSEHDAHSAALSKRQETRAAA